MPQKTSPVWNYFYQDSLKTVRCTLCDKSLKYFGSTTNMSIHFKTKHLKDSFKDDDFNNQDSNRHNSLSPSPRDTSLLETDQVKDSPKKNLKRSTVWKYFEQDGIKVKCKMCTAELKFCGSTTNLLNHYKVKHANEKKNTVKMENDNDDDEDNEPLSKLERKYFPKKDLSRTLEDESKHLEEPGDREKSEFEVENELDIFGRYVAAQLKNLSTVQALQAQKSIINVLMDLRLTNATNSVSVITTRALDSTPTSTISYDCNVNPIE